MEKQLIRAWLFKLPALHHADVVMIAEAAKRAEALLALRHNEASELSLVLELSLRFHLN